MAGCKLAKPILAPTIENMSFKQFKFDESENAENPAPFQNPSFLTRNKQVPGLRDFEQVLYKKAARSLRICTQAADCFYKGSRKVLEMRPS